MRRHCITITPGLELPSGCFEMLNFIGFDYPVPYNSSITLSEASKVVKMSRNKRCSERQYLTQCQPFENEKRHYCCSQKPHSCRTISTMSPSLVFSGRIVQRRLIPSRLHLRLVHFVVIRKQEIPKRLSTAFLQSLYKDATSHQPPIRLFLLP